mmetsp:Transcript_22736/g.37640  ORF Transcript_22736/g.37640 Transcript_22736/m.37640 type:complete len:80 (+) Transcript_22736:190-429(+)
MDANDNSHPCNLNNDSQGLGVQNDEAARGDDNKGCDRYDCCKQDITPRCRTCDPMIINPTTNRKSLSMGKLSSKTTGDA